MPNIDLLNLFLFEAHTSSASPARAQRELSLPQILSNLFSGVTLKHDMHTVQVTVCSLMCGSKTPAVRKWLRTEARRKGKEGFLVIKDEASLNTVLLYRLSFIQSL